MTINESWDDPVGDMVRAIYRIDIIRCRIQQIRTQETLNFVQGEDSTLQLTIK